MRTSKHLHLLLWALLGGLGIHSSLLAADLPFSCMESVQKCLTQAKQNQKMIALLCLVEDDENSLLYVQGIAAHQGLNHLMNEHLQTYHFDAFDQLATTQHYDVRSFPSLILLDMDGRLEAKLGGNKNPDELYETLCSLTGYTPFAYRGVAQAATLTAETGASLRFQDVEDWKVYSFSKLPFEGIGLLYGTYKSPETLREELVKIKKFWRRQIVVYEQVEGNVKSYHLALDNYEESEDAALMQDLIYDGFMIRTTLVSYEKIRERFVE